MQNRIKDVTRMMRRALNTLDYQLMDHGERVAYLLLKLSEAEGIYNEKQLTKISFLGLFHDIGAYQTELLDSLGDLYHTFKFEISDSLEHSIYSYLFLNEHEFFEEYVDSVLFHHFIYEKIQASDCKNKRLAARMYLADRLDIMIIRKLVKTPQDVLTRLKNKVFSPEEVALLEKLEKEQGVITKCFTGEYMDELLEFTTGSKTYTDEIETIIHMLPHTIDFRSEHTVTHTIATVEIAVLLADLFNIGEERKKDVYLGALLHDIGKISVSNMLLEKNGKLTNNEFSIMKDHVLLSEYILRGCVSEEVFRIAVRHHEKLDGSGYPAGLMKSQLTLEERIVAISDVLSALLGRRSYKDPFPMEKVIAILTQEAEAGKLCPEVINKAIENNELIARAVDKCCDEAMMRYRILQDNAMSLRAKYGDRKI